jgi:hypothetical protein
MLGVAVMLLFSPFYLGAVLIGAALGAAIRIHQRRRRRLASSSDVTRRAVASVSPPKRARNRRR